MNGLVGVLCWWEVCGSGQLKSGPARSHLGADIVCVCVCVCVEVRVNISGMYFTPRCGRDAGNYTVMAVNDFGLEMASAYVHVVCQY